MSRRKRGKAEDSTEIDLTPMLDVVFIMLIFFIVTASFVREVGLDVNVPERTEQEQEQQENRNILVRISADNQIEIIAEGQFSRIDEMAIRSNIERMRAELPNAAVVVQAHEDSYAETYVAVADAAYAAGVGTVVLVPTDQRF